MTKPSQQDKKVETAFKMLKPMVLALDISIICLMVSIWVLVPDTTNYIWLDICFGATLFWLAAFHLVLWPILKPSKPQIKRGNGSVWFSGGLLNLQKKQKKQHRANIVVEWHNGNVPNINPFKQRRARE